MSQATAAGTTKAHELVADAYELIEETLEQDEITQADIEKCQTALRRAKEHETAGIFVTLVTEGEINALEHQRYPDGRYNWDSGKTNREVLEEVRKPNKISIST